MTTTPRTAASKDRAGTDILRRLATAPVRWMAAFIAWRCRQAAIAHLSTMSDRELSDIGLTRGQIEPAVLGERARDRAITRYY